MAISKRQVRGFFEIYFLAAIGEPVPCAFGHAIHLSFFSTLATAFSDKMTRWALCRPVFTMTTGSLIFLASAYILDPLMESPTSRPSIR